MINPSRLEDWIAINRPEGWKEGESDPLELRCGEIWEMEEAWESGAQRFGKLPVQRYRMDKNGNVITNPRIVGQVRSLLDPEPAMEGSEFILAWHDGLKWNHDLDTAQSDDIALKPDGSVDEEVLAGWAKNVVETFSKKADGDIKDMIRTFRKDAKAKRPPEEWSLVHAKEWLKDGGAVEAAAIAYAAGKLKGERDTMARLKPVLDLHAKRSRRNEWAQVVMDAMKRHGDDLNAVQLLKRMKGTPERGERYWKFPGGERVDQDTFQSAYKVAKKRTKDGEEE